MLCYFFFYGYGYNQDLPVLTHSFPARRAADLADGARDRRAEARARRRHAEIAREGDGKPAADRPALDDGDRRLRQAFDRLDERSEEHTSELQSLMRISYAVFCLHKTKRLNPRSINTTTEYNTTIRHTNK